MSKIESIFESIFATPAGDLHVCAGCGEIGRRLPRVKAALRHTGAVVPSRLAEVRFV